MSTNQAIGKTAHAPQKPAAARVFTSRHKRIPVVTKEIWAQIEAAARIPHKKRRYPEIVEAPDGAI